MTCVDCGAPATHALFYTCCAGQLPLCGNHVVARGNAIRRYAMLNFRDPAPCRFCGVESTDMPKPMIL